MTGSSDAMKYDRFLGWAKARGIKLADGVAVMNFEGTGRGLGVEGDAGLLPAGSVVVSVPLDAALSTKSAMKCPHLEPLLKDKEAKFAALPPEIIVALHLLVERNKGSDSEYHDWLQTLQTAQEIGNALSAPTDPSQQSMAMKAACKHVEQLRQVLLEKVKPVAQQWAAEGRLPTLRTGDIEGSYGEEPLLWALTQVLSRAHAVNVKSAKDKQLVMLPVIDMLNHRFPKSDSDGNNSGGGASGVRFEDGCFVATNTEVVAPGSQVTISYGPKSNTELLAFYGFCVEDNPYDTAEVDVLLWKDGDAPEMMMAKQNFGLPYLQRLMARKAGKEQDVQDTPSNTMQGLVFWGPKGPEAREVDLSDELTFAARLGSANSLMEIGMAVGNPGLSPAAWQLLRECLVMRNAELKRFASEADTKPAERVWATTQMALVAAAIDLAETNV